MNKDQMNHVVTAWEARAAGRGLKPGSVTYAKMQLEFFLGVHHALEAVGQPGISGALMVLSVGRTAREVFK